MTLDDFRTFCLNKPFVTEGFPFDKNTLVFKVADKMFALTDVESFESVNLKAEPELAIDQRERYIGVKPGYHMHKKHWNTVSINMDVPDDIIYSMIDDSYRLVYDSVPKNIRNEIERRI
jgi:predicted DNA-binding protein (MmcQ/YjbR family)